MRVSLFALAAVLFFCFTGSSFAFDWKALHERADKLSLEEAVAAVKANPGVFENYYLLGLIYLDLHKDSLAEEAFNAVLKLEPQSEEGRWGLAEILRRRHRLKEAEKILNDIMASRPEFSPSYVTLAYIKFIQTDFQEATRLADKVMRQGEREVADTTNYVRAYCLYAGAKGIIAHNAGPISKLVNGTQVLPTLKKAYNLQPESVSVLFGLGSFYLLAPHIAGGNLAEAQSYFQKALEKDPLFPDIYVRLAQLYRLKGDEEKYRAYLEKALEIDPQSELALDIKSGSCKFVCLP